MTCETDTAKRTGTRWLRAARKAGTVTGLAGILLFFAWQAYSLALYMMYRNVVLPTTFGNFDRNIAAAEKLPTDGHPLRFAVIGDSRGYGTFEELMAGLKGSNPDFLVLLGDISRTGKPGAHKFLQAEMASELATDFPVFYVIGNHDVGPGYPLKKWKQTYGRPEFFFRRAGNLFIITYIPGDPYAAAAGLDYLERTLKREAPSAHRVFVFNHIPPRISTDWSARSLPNQERLMKLLEEYRVGYFIAGDYHGYVRQQRGATTFLVSGGGGADLSGGNLGFHHDVLFTVSDDSVEERLCALPKAFGLGDRLESAAIDGLYSFFGRNPLTLLLLDAVAVAIVFFLIKTLRPWRGVTRGAR